MKYRLLTAAGILLLGACSGGGGGGGGDSTDIPEQIPVPDTGNADADILLSKGIEAFTTRDAIADPDDLFYDRTLALAPETGEINYEGLTQFSQNGFTAVGSFSASVDFGDAKKVEATADDFFQITSEDPRGLSFVEALAAYEIAGSIDGTLDFEYDIVEQSGLTRLIGGVEGSLTDLDGNVYTISENMPLPRLETLPNSGGGFSGPDLDTLTINELNLKESTFTRVNSVGLRQP